MNEIQKEASMVIRDCKFIGVQFDKAAVSAMSLIAKGLLENAKGLSYLAYVLRTSNVSIDSMMKISGNELNMSGDKSQTESETEEDQAKNKEDLIMELLHIIKDKLKTIEG